MFLRQGPMFAWAFTSKSGQRLHRSKEPNRLKRPNRSCRHHRPNKPDACLKPVNLKPRNFRIPMRRRRRMCASSSLHAALFVCVSLFLSPVCTRFHEQKWARAEVCTRFHEQKWARAEVCTRFHEQKWARAERWHGPRAETIVKRER